eukprot:gb/GECH01014295.1/.p1 GENE.gb/GECH01014295.1/~~gb/GECH01014295.1/.p1  ORF type:complete len:110 (+),score=16.07 gb/GECH01014295.1/:1-330(+)
MKYLLCDGLSVNLSLSKELADEGILVIYDYPHLTKNLRNALFESIKNNEGNEFGMFNLIELVKTDDQVRNLLSNEALCPPDTQNVPLALEVLSKKLADYLKKTYSHKLE